MRPLILLVPALLAALELPTPSLELHPDGARVAWTLTLPAGHHQVDLPAWCGKALTVSGASSWSYQEEPGVPAPFPEAVAALLGERNRLVASAAGQAAALAAFATAEQRWRDAVTLRASAGEADTATWQAGLEALISERTRLDAEGLRLEAARRALTGRAFAAGGTVAVGALGLEGSDPLTATTLANAWSRSVGAGGPRAHLDLQLAAAGTVRLEEQRRDCRWIAECDLRLGAAGSAVLVRRAVVKKPAVFAPGRITVIASAAPLSPQLAAPQPPEVWLLARPVADALRKLVSSGNRQVTWEDVPAASTMMARSAPGGDAATADIAGMEIRGRAGSSVSEQPRDVEVSTVEVAPSSVVFDLGSLDLASGTDRLVAALGETTLAISADEWAFFPEDRPTALRRVTVKLDGRPLLPGRIRVASAGQLPVEGTVPWIPGGGSLTVCAGIDERLVVTTNSAWEVWPGTNTKQRRREGRDTWLINASPRPVTVAVYRTMPVSTVEEVVVEPDPGTTPGGKAVIPGLLRWEILLPPGMPTRIGVGWTLRAGGSFSFE